MGLTPDQAAKHIKETPHGRVAFYDEAKGEIVKPDGWRPPEFQVADRGGSDRTRQIRSVMCLRRC